jgi:hypothetical protein
MNVKCNKCGYTANESEFPTGTDFFQNTYISGCPQCDNRQNPGDASLRMMPGMEHPFTYIRSEAESDDPLDKTLHNASEAS